MRVNVFLISMKHALIGRKKSAKISIRIQLLYKCNNKSVHYNCNTTILLRRDLRTPSSSGLWHSGNWTPEAFKALYLGDSSRHTDTHRNIH